MKIGYCGQCFAKPRGRDWRDFAVHPRDQKAERFGKPSVRRRVGLAIAGMGIIVSNETKESLREKLAHARDTLDEVNDPGARAFIRAEIEELEGHLPTVMASGPES